MLKLVQLVEGRYRDSMEIDMDSPRLSTPSHGQQSSQSSASSDTNSPAQSVFSRGYSRVSSTASSVPSSPVFRDSDEGFGSAKRPLTDVKEEPQEPEEDFELANVAGKYFYDGFDGFHNHFDVTQSPLPIAATPEYDLADQEFSYGGIHTTPSKKQRSGDSPLSGLSSRIGTKFASFSRKWKNRQGPEAVIAVDRLDQPIRARANSASSTIVSPAVSSISRRDSHIPPSPARTVFEERLSESGVAPIDIQKANDQSEEEQEGQARTPLLPPLMVDFPSYLRDSPVQSPLQSPTVADAAESSKLNTPVESQTPRLPGLPSPPLSSNPSMSSVHRHFASQVVPSTEIPPIHIADPNDEWSRKLGHANFNIHPEPYTPETFDAESYKQSRANWDLARCNYTKHLFRTGEHYGTTSKIYRLTEEKWAEVDTQWKQSNQLIVSNLQDGGNDDEMGLAIEAQDPAPEAMKVPPLDDPTGKFPQLGDEDIVGPMAVGPALYRDPTPPQSRPSRKRNFLRFLQDFLGRSTASSQRP